MDLIYCRGGDKQAPGIAKAAGVLYGTRYDYKPYAAVFMLDGGAGSVDWRLYLDKTCEHQPIMALTPDYFTPDARTLLTQIDELRALGVARICVCPKFRGAVGDIPDDCVVAVSVPTSYAGFLPHAAELVGRRIHFLGGHPDQIAHLMTVYQGAEIISADMNIIGRKADLGQFWRTRGGWQTAPNSRFESRLLAIHSWRNVRAYLNAPKQTSARRVQRVMYAAPLL